MKLSIIIPVLNSHEIVRRQLLYYVAMPLADDTELILVDDGSDPPLKLPRLYINSRIIWTNDSRPWTQPKGARKWVRKA